MAEKDKDSKGYTVEGTVDVCDRPSPNADPDGKGNWAYEQNPHIEGVDKDIGKRYD